MPKVYAYVRILHDDGTGDALAGVRTQAADFFRAHLRAPGWRWGGLVEDEPKVAGRPFLSRPGGFRLSGRLERGDVVLVPRLARSFKNIPDLIAVARAWHERGVRLRVLDADLDTATAEGWRLLQFAAGLQQMRVRATGDGVKRRILRRKADGLPVGRPPWGLRKAGLRAHRRYEVIPEYYALAKAVVAWHAAGHSWAAIHQHLKAAQFRLRYGPGDQTGKSLSPEMVKKAYAKGLQLLAWVEEGRYKVPGDRGARHGQEVGQQAAGPEAAGGGGAGAAEPPGVCGPPGPV